MRAALLSLCGSLLACLIPGGAALAQPAPGELRADRRCRSDGDCVFQPPLCPRCPPCEPTWRPVCNTEQAVLILQGTKNRRCPRVDCPRCARTANWLGRKPVCLAGQCTVEGATRPDGQPVTLPPPPTLAPSPDLACRRDADCRLDPPAVCACDQPQSCEPTWRRAMNRAAYRRAALRAKSVRARCVACRACPPGAAFFLGARAVCLKGQCAVR